MKTKTFLTLLILGMVVTSFLSSCENNIIESINEEQGIGLPSMNTLISNELITIKAYPQTRGDEKPKHLVTVSYLDDIYIVVSENDSDDCDKYPTKSLFYKIDGTFLTEMHSNVTEDENGYAFEYNCLGGDIDCSYFPKEAITRAAKNNDVGQGTMDCITDAYTNHGWVSVWVWVQTAFIPETAVAIAADCVVHQLF